MTTRIKSTDGLRSKERVPELEMLRGIAILGVIMVHATSTAVAAVQNSMVRGVYVLLNTFSLFCVPTFIFLSGFVLFYNYFDRPLTLRSLGTFYRKRIKQLVVPYLFVSLGYELVEQALKHRTTDFAAFLTQFGEHLLTGKSYPHLYYILITIQLYLLFPLLLLVFQKLRMSVKLAIPLGFAVQWAFYLLNRHYWHIGTKGSWSFTYFAAFLIGAYLGMRVSAFERWFSIGEKNERQRSGYRIKTILLTGLWLAVAVGFIWMHYEYRTGGHTLAGYWFEIGYNLFTLSTALILLKVCFWLQKHRTAHSLASVLSDLGTLSFGIYLIHPFFLLLYHLLPPASAQPLIYHLWTAGGYLFALGSSLVVLLLAHRYIRGAWMLLGPAPAKFQTEQTEKEATPIGEVLRVETNE